MNEILSSIRAYGTKPYKAALIHGGPGAAGDMKPPAEELSKYFGVIEPLQTRKTVESQIEELFHQISVTTNSPVTLTGHSWGGFLALKFSAEHPELVKKLILVSSGPFEEKYTLKMMETRINHLSEEDKKRYFQLIEDSSGIMTEKLGALLSKADTYEKLPGTDAEINFDPELHLSVWNEAKQLRKEGKFLEYAGKVKCPVIAIHGEYDTHPIEGVTETIGKIIKDFRMIVLEKCGHYPWKEKFAREKFYEILIEEII